MSSILNQTQAYRNAGYTYGWGGTAAYKTSVQAAEEKHFKLVYLVPGMSASKACNEEQWRMAG